MHSPTEQLHLLMQLVYETLEEDPVDFEGARIDKQSAVAITCSHVLELYLSIQSNSELSPSDKHALWLSVVAKSIVENQVLHARLLQIEKVGAIAADTPLNRAAEEETLMLLEKLHMLKNKDIGGNDSK